MYINMYANGIHQYSLAYTTRRSVSFEKQIWKGRKDKKRFIETNRKLYALRMISDAQFFFFQYFFYDKKRKKNRLQSKTDTIHIIIILLYAHEQ